MGNASQKPKSPRGDITIARRSWLLLLAAGLLIGGVGLWSSSCPAWLFGSDAADRPADLAIMQVMPRSITRTLDLVGTIEAGGGVNVTAPFEGLVRERLVEFGRRVERGQVMLVLNSAEVELQLREAEVDVIKAAQALQELQNWEDGSEVARARHAVLSTQLKVDELLNEEKESKALLSRGIIPRNEYDRVVSELKAQELQLAVARQDLNAVLRKGGDQHRHVAQLKLDNTTKRLEELQRRDLAGVIRAPVSGLVLRPTPSSSAEGATQSEVQVGSRLSMGQALFTIADTETLKVQARVHEIDVNLIREGQSVTVTGDAFRSLPLVGEVTQISAQANSRGSGTPQDSVFEVNVAIASIAPELRDRVRIGMSAELSIVTYQNTNALVVPASAVQSGLDGPSVLLHDPATGLNERVPVSLGQPTENGVEILTGVNPGDSLVIGETTVVQHHLGDVETPVLQHLSPSLTPGGESLGAN